MEVRLWGWMHRSSPWSTPTRWSFRDRSPSIARRVNAAPEQELSGRVARIDPVADPGTRQVGVYVRLANAKHQIIAGQFATGRIVGERIENAIVIPEVAVRGEGDSTFVLVVADGRVAKQPVTVGPSDRSTGQVSIAKGLEGGERIIVTPSLQLAAGTQVVLASDKAAAPGETARGTSGGR